MPKLQVKDSYPGFNQSGAEMTLMPTVFLFGLISVEPHSCISCCIVTKVTFCVYAMASEYFFITCK